MSLEDARQKMDAWLKDYNEVRPHSVIGNRTPISLIDHPGTTVPERPQTPEDSSSAWPKYGEQLNNRQSELKTG
jgi:hypothetical protein